MIATIMFGCLVYPDLEELDLVGPWEMASLWHAYADGPACVTIGPSDAPVRCRHGLQIVPDTASDEAPRLDYLLVPGGNGSRAAAQDPRLLDVVQAAASTAQVVASVCTGVRVLRAAGLLDGRRVTTHWSALDEARAWPEVEVVEQRHVRDGQVWTSAGVSAGMDLMLAVIAEEAGEDVAATVQRRAEYFPDARRYGSDDWPDAPEYLRGEE